MSRGLLTPSRISALLRENDIRPRQTLGQNFLADPNSVRRIVSLAGIRPGDRVLEIGPGLGSLTLGLVSAGAEVVAVEADSRLAGVCRKVVPEARVVEGNAAKMNLAPLLTREGWRCVSNLPYNVAVPVIVKLLETVPAVDHLLVMVQAELGDRLLAGPGARSRAAVSLKVEYYTTARFEGPVPRSVFIPVPSVESSLVSMVRRRPPIEADPEKLFSLVGAAFRQRRKTLRQSLAPHFGSAAAAETALRAAGVDPSARAEDLTLSQFARIAS